MMLINYLFMAIGQFLECCAFLASMPATVLHALAQQFYFAGNPMIDNNDEEDDEE